MTPTLSSQPGARPITLGGSLRLLTLLALGSLAAGFGILAAYCLAESAASGVSLADAYWRGALPWMGIAEGLVVGGATATLLAGGLATLVRGGWWRRAALLPLIAVAGMWWFLAVMGAGVNYAPCIGCPARAVDPWAYAYSLPETALAFLILPALGVAALALAPRRSSVSRR